MVELKFVFSNIRRTEVKRTLPNRFRRSVAQGKHEEITGSADKSKKKEIPLFYQHKIRAPKYEYY